MRQRLLLGAGIAVLAAVAVLASGIASANPTGLFISGQSCAGDGTVSAFLNWTPDSSGQQFVDLTGRNDNFGSVYATGGPYNITQTRANLVRLQPSTTYYTRVRTQIGGQFLFSPTLAFTTISCGGGGQGGGSITPPSNLVAAPLSATSVRFQWVPGNNNHFFCLDYARSLNDLFGIFGTWRNSGCGQILSSHVLSGLACGTTYYARIWTSTSGGLYSAPTQVTTSSCASAITAPTNLRVISVGKTTAHLDWTPGQNNRWFCVDTATSRDDLFDFDGSWRNHDCWTSASQAEIGGLTCGTLYYWRVYAWNEITNIHSGVDTFQTDACDAGLQQAPINDVEVTKVGDDYHASIEAVRPNSCHSFDSYSMQRSGNVVDITVLNAVSSGPCNEVETTYDLTVNLGSNFTSGVTYTVVVNDDESDTFLAD